MTANANQELVRKIVKMLSADNEGQLVAACNALKAQCQKYGMTLEELMFFAFGDISALIGNQGQAVDASPQSANFGSSTNPPTAKDQELFSSLEHIYKTRNQAPNYTDYSGAPAYGRRRRAYGSARPPGGVAWLKLSPWEKNFATDIVDRFTTHPFAFSPKQREKIQTIIDKAGASFVDIDF